MTWLRRWLVRLAEVVSRRSFDKDLDDELAFHLESEAERLQREEGLSPREARRRARHGFDGLERCKEDVRDARGLPALTFLGRDFKYGLRELAGHPTFTIVAVLSLALGIGLNVAVFSVVDATLFRPYPYDPDDRLVNIRVDEQRANGVRNRLLWVHEYDALTALADVFEDVQGHSPEPGRYLVNRAGSPLGRLRFARASAGYFELLGTRPILGRGFVQDDMRLGDPEVAVLSYDTWQARFGSDPAVIGETVWLLGDRSVGERTPVTIVGVLPEDANTQFNNFEVGGVVPMRYQGPNYLVKTLARLAPGVTAEQAAVAMEAAIPSPEGGPTLDMNVSSYRESETARLRPTLRLFLGVVMAVLLIACANVAALTLSRAATRRREVATRLALGASRWRIAQLFLAEGTLLALAGGASGTVLAYSGVQVIRFLNNVENPWTPQLFPQMTDAGVDGRVLAYTLVVSMVAALLCSVAPALSGSRLALGRALHSARRGVTPGRFRLANALVVGQVALALVLLTGAGLVVRSTANLLAVDPGFEMDRLLTVRVSLPGDVYLEQVPADVPAKRDPRAFHAELVERVGRMPGVVSAAEMTWAPFEHFQGAARVMLGDRPPPPPGERQFHVDAQMRFVVGDVFTTLGIPVLRGRGLTADDTLESAPVVVISKNMADEYWPDGNPVGQMLWFADREGRPRDGDRPRQIVGVVGDTRQWGPQFEPDPFVYAPHGQLPLGWGSILLGGTLLVRTEGVPESLVPAVRRVAADLDPEWAVVSDAHSLREWASIWTDGTRFSLLLLLVFAAVGLGLALIGVYGVMAHAVTRRTPEIGIRMALGAMRHQVLMLVVRQGVVLGITGIVLGLVGAWWLTELVGTVNFAGLGGSILYGVEPLDAATFVASAVLLFGAVLLACYAPTRRATRVDPLTVLQHE